MISKYLWLSKNKFREQSSYELINKRLSQILSTSISFFSSSSPSSSSESPIPNPSSSSDRPIPPSAILTWSGISPNSYSSFASSSKYFMMISHLSVSPKSRKLIRRISPLFIQTRFFIAPLIVPTRFLPSKHYTSTLPSPNRRKTWPYS